MLANRHPRGEHPAIFRFSVRAGNIGAYSPYLHLAMPEELVDDTWSGVLVALAEPVESAPDDAALANELVDSVIVALLGADADHAIDLLRQAYANANTWLYTQNLQRGTRRRVAMGLSCLLLVGEDLFVAQVPPGQIMIRQDDELFAFPPLESWSPSFQPDRTYELPNPLGLRSETEPQIYYTRAEPHDQVFALSSSVARHLPGLSNRLRSATSIDETERLLLDLASSIGVSSGYGAVIEVPAVRTPGWWRGRGRPTDAVLGFDSLTQPVDDTASRFSLSSALASHKHTRIENSPAPPLDQNAPSVQTEGTESRVFTRLGLDQPGQPGPGRAVPENRSNDPDDDRLGTSLTPASQPALAMRAGVHLESPRPVAIPFQESVGILGTVSRFLAGRRQRRAGRLSDEHA